MSGSVPAWYRALPFLGRAPPLTPLQWRVLGLVAAVSFFEQYDMYLFALNLKQIQADLGIPESQLGLLGAVVRAGAFLAVFFALSADRFGRRKLLLITVLGYTVLTGLTAFSPNAETFVILQFLARGFAAAEVMLAAVVIAEVFAPEHRGWGIGALAALQATGAGFASIMFGFVDVLPYGWRSLYLIGFFPLLLIAYWRRTLPETGRFEAIAETTTQTGYFSPMRGLFENNPVRTSALFTIVFLFAMGASAAGFFAPKYLQDVHGWTPANVAVLSFIGGALAIIANPLAGYLSDRHGRRPITMIFAGVYFFTVAGFYLSSGFIIPLLWIALIFFVMGTDVTLTSFGTELFPTRQRSTATGFRGLISTLAGILGLSAVSALYLVFESNWISIVIVASICLAVPLLVWLFLPETARRPLEEISPD